jgi:hypothetical protein
VSTSEDKPGNKLLHVVAALAGSQIGYDAESIKEPPTRNNVLDISLRHAAALFTDGTAIPKGNEEHKTSAFMGYWGACLNLYNMISVLSGGAQASLLWNAQSKAGNAETPGEAETGGDFGIAFALGEKRYKLAFFQAKELRTKDKKDYLDINRPSGKYKAANGDDGLRRQADLELIGWCNDDEIAIKTDGYAHQLSKLARMQQRHPGTDWVYYALWGNEEGSPPRVIPIARVQSHLKKNKLDANGFASSGMRSEHAHVPLSATATLTHCTYDPLVDLLAEGVSDKPHKGWLLLDQDKAVKLIGEFSPLGVQWFIAEGESTGGLVDELASQGCIFTPVNTVLDGVANNVTNAMVAKIDVPADVLTMGISNTWQP